MPGDGRSSIAGTTTRPQVPIEVQHLTKRFGSLVAVDDLSFRVNPGRVTGFLGPNGSGKTTTLRMTLDLVRPTAGQSRIGGKRYVDLPRPLTVVGAALEATNFHPGRSGRDHLRALAVSNGLPSSRVDFLLDLVGIPAAARKRAGAYSMGMRQRLGLAAALLGDPAVVIADEPANGLDPEGIRWLRGLLRDLAAQGKTVLVSSHMLAEMQQIADDVVIIANGRLVSQGSIAELEGRRHAFVRCADPGRLASALNNTGMPATARDGGLEVQTDNLVAIGDTALEVGVAIHELRSEGTDLEALFFQLTQAPEHRNRNLGAPPTVPPPTGSLNSMPPPGSLPPPGSMPPPGGPPTAAPSQRPEGDRS